VQAAECGARTLIFATHWQREASLADRIVYLQDG
jgi:ATP-binding cassette subfamily C protein CydC